MYIQKGEVQKPDKIKRYQYTIGHVLNHLNLEDLYFNPEDNAYDMTYAENLK